ncbi:MAG: hypothetical protein WC135_02790 [Bacteroidales bacterium]
MNLLNDEKVLKSYAADYITLTTHRIRQKEKSMGRMSVISIMLEKITSCVYKRKSMPLLIIIGVMAVIFGIVFLNYDDSGMFYLIIGVVLIIFYFLTITRVLCISSAAGKIIIIVGKLKDKEVEELIDIVESAKNNRYLYKKEDAE